MSRVGSFMIPSISHHKPQARQFTKVCFIIELIKYTLIFIKVTIVYYQHL